MPKNSNLGLPEKPWSMASDEVASNLQVSVEEGLNPKEAGRRLQDFGPNLLQEKKRIGAWRILANQFKSLIIGILAIASLAAFVFGRHLEGVAVAVALLINILIGFFTELKATRSMEALQRLGRVRTRVRRGGESREIHARDLVPGDLVLIDAGDVISADLRLLSANNLQVDESPLTGESVPVGKSTDPLGAEIDLAERTNMLFKGTAVTSGSGEGVVVATGMATEIGTIASLTQEAKDEMTPLEKRLERLGRRLIVLTLLLGAVVAISGIIGGMETILMMETAIAMAIAAVPEGLPIVATMALARGMWRMAGHNALINRLSAVEALGATTVICTDKTGTLTENRMTVKLIALPEGEVEIAANGEFRLGDERIDPAENERLLQALETGIFCNNAELRQDGEVGDPMETALLRAGRQAGLERRELRADRPEAREEAFSTETKMMATFHEEGDGYRVAVKGAPEAVLKICSRVSAPGGKEPLDDAGRKEWFEHNRGLAGRGLRLIALAGKRGASLDENPYEGLTLYGLAGLADPPRGDVQAALEECRRAGIRVIMVTGDQPATARGIAASIGLETDGAEALAGRELDDPERLSPEQKKRILQASIFARVAPKQKLTLIALHQEQGDVVAMTGDGVNDAPALKKADIGVAMGQRGTQVAKEAADMILKDDRFATIVIAVRYGRTIFNNIRKFIFYLLSGNVSQVLILTIASLAGMPLPLLPLQILYINLIGDVFPALALGLGEATPGIMDRPPRNPREQILTRRHWLGIGGYAIVFTVAVLGVFALCLYRLQMPAEEAVTVSFSSLVLARLWHMFNMRDAAAPMWRNEVTGNPYVWGALAIGFGLLALAIYVPTLAAVLGLRPPGGDAWLLILAASLVPLLFGQAGKLLRRSIAGKK